MNVWSSGRVANPALAYNVMMVSIECVLRCSNITQLVFVSNIRDFELKTTSHGKKASSLGPCSEVTNLNSSVENISCHNY